MLYLYYVLDATSFHYAQHTQIHTSFNGHFFPGLHMCQPVPDCQTKLYFDTVGDDAGGR